MSTNHSLRTAPGTMIANVPGILGFYPHEAAVVMTVCADGDDGYMMGPVIRGDLDQIDGLADVIASLEPAAPIELAVAVIVTDDIGSPAARAAQEELFCAADAQGRALLHACWHVPEIVTDAPYTLLFGPHGDEPGWRTGRVGNVATSEAMAPHLASGILPVADQHVIDEYFALRPVADGAALAEQAAAALATAPPDVFVAQARHAAALAPAEQQLRQLLEDVQRDRWDEHACRRTCDAIVPQLEQVSLALQTHVSVADLAAKEAGSASLAAHDVDTLLAAAGLAHAQLRTLAERTGLAADDAVEQAASLVRIARRARVPARNMVRILTSLRAAHEAVHIESVPQLPGLGQLSSQLAALAAKMAHGVCALVRATEIDAGAATPDALRAALPDDGAAAVRDAERLAATLDALHTAIADPANAIPVDDAVPWTARASTLHAAMQHSAAHDAEIAERTARRTASTPRRWPWWRNAARRWC